MSVSPSIQGTLHVQSHFKLIACKVDSANIYKHFTGKTISVVFTEKQVFNLVPSFERKRIYNASIGCTSKLKFKTNRYNYIGTL